MVLLKGEDELVSFGNWPTVLAQADLPFEVKRDYKRDIVGLLRACKDARRPLSVGFIQWYLSRRGLSETERSYERESYKWLFREARRAGGVRQRAGAFVPPSASPPAREAQSHRSQNLGSAGLPPPRAAADLGSTDWEQELVKTIRQRGLLWRTEQTYRQWAKPFAVFIAPDTPWQAGGEQVQAFLTRMAVEQRASAATQKQALNALAFFMQQALRIDLGDLAFRRARPRRKLPVVLSREEVARLLAAMPRGYRLMGEVMYGSGLRLMELLRLRVHHLDLERRQVAVYAGKGAKDRVTVMSESLVPLVRQAKPDLSNEMKSNHHEN